MDFFIFLHYIWYLGVPKVALFCMTYYNLVLFEAFNSIFYRFFLIKYVLNTTVYYTEMISTETKKNKQTMILPT